MKCGQSAETIKGFERALLSQSRRRSQSANEPDGLRRLPGRHLSPESVVNCFLLSRRLYVYYPCLPFTPLLSIRLLIEIEITHRLRPIQRSPMLAVGKANDRDYNG